MKTPNLLNVPKDSPTRKERIEAFRKLNGIETHDCGGSCDDEYPRWVAAHMPSVYTLGYGVKDGMSLGECAALVCRLMDEAGYTAYGKTERKAIICLCDNLGIQCDL
jgi:hypothetical protein